MTIRLPRGMMKKSGTQALRLEFRIRSSYLEGRETMEKLDAKIEKKQTKTLDFLSHLLSQTVGKTGAKIFTFEKRNTEKEKERKACMLYVLSSMAILIYTVDST